MSPALIFKDRRVNLCSAMHKCNARLTLKTIRNISIRNRIELNAINFLPFLVRYADTTLDL
jgi:hypothetical protein